MPIFRNEDFFQVIGHISVFYATLDFFVSVLILRLLKGERKAKMPFDDNATLGQKLKFLEKLKPRDVVDVDVLSDALKVLPQAKELSRERNRYIHDQWMFSPDIIPTGVIGRTTIIYHNGGRMELSNKTFKIEELYIFLKKVGELQKVFGVLLQRLPVS